MLPVRKVGASSGCSLSDSNSDEPHTILTEAKAAAIGRVQGFVSRAGEGVGRSDNDRQFFYLNGRPVDIPKVSTRV